VSVMRWHPGLSICLPSHELKARLQMDKPSARCSPQCDAQAVDDFHLTVKTDCSAHVSPSVLLWGSAGKGGAGPCGSCVVLSQDQLHTRRWQCPAPAAITTEMMRSGLVTIALSALLMPQSARIHCGGPHLEWASDGGEGDTRWQRAGQRAGIKFSSGLKKESSGDAEYG